MNVNLKKFFWGTEIKKELSYQDSSTPNLKLKKY